jgi:hypothetical protein
MVFIVVSPLKLGRIVSLSDFGYLRSSIQFCVAFAFLL